MSDPFSAATLATLHEIKREIKERSADVIEDKSKIMDAMDAARIMTAIIESMTKMVFQPRVETHYASFAQLYGQELNLDHPLYEITALTNGDGSVIDSSAYTLLPRSGPPYQRIRLDSDLVWLSDASGNTEDVIEISGVWVAGKPRSGQWLTNLDTVGADSAGASLNLSWTPNLDPFGREPRYSPGQLLRLTKDGVSEYVAVLEATKDAAVTVRRAERGTSLMTDCVGATVDLWWVDQIAQIAAARGAGFFYARRGHFHTSEFDEMNRTSKRWAAFLPADVLEYIAQLKPAKSPLMIRSV